MRYRIATQLEEIEATHTPLGPVRDGQWVEGIWVTNWHDMGYCREGQILAGGLLWKIIDPKQHQLPEGTIVAAREVAAVAKLLDKRRREDAYLHRVGWLEQDRWRWGLLFCHPAQSYLVRDLDFDNWELAEIYQPEAFTVV